MPASAAATPAAAPMPASLHWNPESVRTTDGRRATCASTTLAWIRPTPVVSDALAVAIGALTVLACIRPTPVVSPYCEPANAAGASASVDTSTAARQAVRMERDIVTSWCCGRRQPIARIIHGDR